MVTLSLDKSHYLPEILPLAVFILLTAVYTASPGMTICALGNALSLDPLPANTLSCRIMRSGVILMTVGLKITGDLVQAQ